MNTTNKHKKSIDFFSLSQRKDIKAISKNSKDKIPFDFKSFLLKNGTSFKSLLKLILSTIRKFKKFFYKRFFWGRGMYYKYSVFISIVIVSIPVVVLAQNIKSPTPTDYSNTFRGVDTALDNGVGKVQIADDSTIQSVHSYIVQGGDTISSISSKFNITSDTLTYTNNLTTDAVLQVGQSLKILPESGILYTVQKNDTLESISTKFHISQSGYSAQVLLDLNLLDSNTLKEGQELLVPGAIIDKPSKGVSVQASVPSVSSSSTSNTQKIATVSSNNTVVVPKAIYIAPSSSGKFMSPTGGYGNITTCFSSLHPAVDVDSLKGPVPLYAAASGTVTYAGYGLSGGSGLAIRIDHGNGYVTEYLHFSQLGVSVGDNVRQGQYIGMMGETGRAFGIHVHWIVKYNGINQNPMNYVDFSSYGRERDSRGVC